MKSEKRQENRRELMQMLRRIDPTGDTDEAVRQYEEKKRKTAVLMMAAVILLTAAAAFFPTANVLQAGGVLIRRAAGEGDYIVSLIATISGNRIETQVSVAEQALSGEAVQELFEAAEAELIERMLGENESADEVFYDLTLPSETEDGLVTAQWAFDSYALLDANGSIREEVPEDGEVVEVTLTMTYLDETAQSVFSIRVLPQPLSEEALLEQSLEEALTEADADSAQEEAFVLPDEVNGAAVSWSLPDEHLWLKVLLLGLAAVAIMLYEMREQVKRAAERRDEQMMEDYAAIVNKLSLLLGAGMTVYGAWEKIVINYMQEQKTDQEGKRESPAAGAKVLRRAAYEEMRVTYAQIRSGAGEAGAYEEFGRRCGLRPYLKLSAILARNLKLGTQGVTTQLLEEADEAFEQRKMLAKRKGEEAGTKLLGPMMMLLGVVMAIVVIPGFLSF